MECVNVLSGRKREKECSQKNVLIRVRKGNLLHTHTQTHTLSAPNCDHESWIWLLCFHYMQYSVLYSALRARQRVSLVHEEPSFMLSHHIIFPNIYPGGRATEMERESELIIKILVSKISTHLSYT